MSPAPKDTRRRNKAERIRRVGALAKGKFVSAKSVPEVLRCIIEPGDILCLEGDNQKQADFLANQLATLTKKVLRDIHLVMSCLTLPAHIELFKKGLIRQVDFCYAGPQGQAVAQLLADGKFPIGAFICYGMFGDRIDALESASVGLMPIEAMSAVTKIPAATLEKLSKTMPSLEFGAKPFALLGYDRRQPRRPRQTTRRPQTRPRCPEPRPRRNGQVTAKKFFAQAPTVPSTRPLKNASRRAPETFPFSGYHHKRDGIRTGIVTRPAEQRWIQSY
jgi:Malonate decarboxylase, alpha subunit, transporter/Malonate decarboxylase gamma subunit (MdcE)